MGIYNETDALAVGLGDTGVTNVNTTSTFTASSYNTKYWRCIQVLETGTTFSSLVEEGADGDTYDTSTSFTEGTVLYGKFTSFALSSGSVRAYKDNDTK